MASCWCVGRPSRSRSNRGLEVAPESDFTGRAGIADDSG
jgi:hypothetical protein